MVNFKKVSSYILVLLMFVLICVPTFAARGADNTGGANASNSKQEKEAGTKKYDDINSKDKFEWDDESTGNAEGVLKTMFLNDAYDNYNIDSAVQLSTPFVVLALTFTLFILMIAFYFFVSCTAVDLMAILVAPTRRFLVGRTQQHGTSQGMMGGGADSHHLLCLSDAAMEVLGYSGNNSGMGGMSTGDRGSEKSKLLRYATMKSKEMFVFIMFVLIFFTPLLGFGVLTIFNFMKSLIAGIMNMF